MNSESSINSYISTKISIVTFLCIIMVVVLHSYNLEVHFGAGTIYNSQTHTRFLEEFISNGLCRLAVPFLFCISGFLFFKSENYRLNLYSKQVKRRIQTLFIPYLIWAIWGIVFYYILQSFPESSEFFTKDNIRSFTIYDYLDKMLMNPIPYQLWFIRDLMIIVVVAPLLYITIKFLNIIPVLLVFGLWLFNVNTVLIVNEGLFFFTVGAFIALKNIRLPSIPNILMFILLLLYLSILFFKTALQETSQYNHYYKASILIGLPCIWFLYDKIFTKKRLQSLQFFLSINTYSFFIYLFHEPLLTIIKKGLMYMLSYFDYSTIIVYIITPLLVISTSIFIANVFKRHFPNFYKYIAGGR
jgi:surface polysaccharide O-acyltransferase-like enzyme